MIVSLSSPAKLCATLNESNAACVILQDPVTVLFPAIEEAGGKLFTEHGGQRKIGHPRSVKDATFGRSKSFMFIALSLGPFGTGETELGG